MSNMKSTKSFLNRNNDLSGCSSPFGISLQMSPQQISFHAFASVVWQRVLMPDAFPDTALYFYPGWGPPQQLHDSKGIKRV